MVTRPRPSGIGPITAAIVQALRADADVIAIVPAARILNDVPAGTARPYLRVAVLTEAADDTLGLPGVDASVSVVAVSDYRGADEIGRIASAVRSVLDGAEVPVVGFRDLADVLFDQSAGEYDEDVAGVMVRFRPLVFRVRVL